jgi:hypothetical protein
MWLGCGEYLIGFWVGTWGRVFRYGASVVFFSFKNAVHTGHFFRSTSSSRRETKVDGSLARASTVRVGLGVSGDTIVSGSCACPSHLWISRVLTSSSSLGISSLFCRVTQYM